MSKNAHTKKPGSSLETIVAFALNHPKKPDPKPTARRRAWINKGPDNREGVAAAVKQSSLTNDRPWLKSVTAENIRRSSGKSSGYYSVRSGRNRIIICFESCGSIRLADPCHTSGSGCHISRGVGRANGQ